MRLRRGRGKERCLYGASLQLRGSTRIAKDTMLEEGVRRRADAREAVQLELEEDRALGIAAACAHVAARDDAHGPAAASVLEAQEALEGVLLVERVVPPA